MTSHEEHLTFAKDAMKEDKDFAAALRKRIRHKIKLIEREAEAMFVSRMNPAKEAELTLDKAKDLEKEQLSAALLEAAPTSALLSCLFNTSAAVFMKPRQ